MTSSSVKGTCLLVEVYPGVSTFVTGALGSIEQAQRSGGWIRGVFWRQNRIGGAHRPGDGQVGVVPADAELGCRIVEGALLVEEDHIVRKGEKSVKTACRDVESGDVRRRVRARRASVRALGFRAERRRSRRRPLRKARRRVCSSESHRAVRARRCAAKTKRCPERNRR